MESIVIGAFLRLAVFALALFGGCVHAEEKVGVILLHGKNAPKPIANFEQLYYSAKKKGYLVEAPYLPWAKGRLYDKTYEAALEDIDDVVKRARAEGAAKIVVIGHSLGGNAAVGYAALKNGADAIVAIVPGPFLNSRKYQERISESTAKARDMVATGHADDTATFEDLNMGAAFPIRTTAKIFLSYTEPDGNALMVKNAERMNRSIPVLWVMGDKDPSYGYSDKQIFPKFPAHPKSAVIVVDSGHVDAPDKAADQIVRWIEALD